MWTLCWTVLRETEIEKIPYTADRWERYGTKDEVVIALSNIQKDKEACSLEGVLVFPAETDNIATSGHTLLKKEGLLKK